jgi:hypothetical protein
MLTYQKIKNLPIKSRAYQKWKEDLWFFLERNVVGEIPTTILFSEIT